MTVEELILQLSKFDKDIKVVISGYEYGHDDCDDAQEIIIIKNTLVSYYSGKYDIAEASDKDIIKAIAII
jgi:arabinogalactan endo-1,4-beta-galactosidase